MASIPPEEENYVRMSLLLSGICPRAARIFFDNEFAPVGLASSLKKASYTLTELKNTNRINQSQWNLLFPRAPDKPDSKTFDINLIVTLLRNLTDITPPLRGFDMLPADNDITPGADLARIKYYRNYLAHLDDVIVETTYFNIAWVNLSRAIERLAGQRMRHECDQLRIKTFDQTNAEIQMDLKRSTDEIKELQGSLDSWKISTATMTEEVQRLTISHDEAVPWNVRDSIEDYARAWAKQEEVELGILPEWVKQLGRIKHTLESWKQNDDNMFISTRAAKHILNCVKTNNCVLIVASSGVGKTCTLRHVALQMAKHEYEVLTVTVPSDIVKFYNPSKKMLFIVDDLCGKWSVEQCDISSWDAVIGDIQNILEQNNTKIIAACRLQVYKDEQFRSLSIFKSCVCNLLSENMCLSETEKQSIAELYLKEKNTEIKNFLNMYDCFPLLCKQYYEDPTLNVKDFFQNPFSVYENEIDELFKKGKYTKYCVLALCVMFNNQLQFQIFTEDVSEEVSTIIKNTCEACRLNRGTSKFLLRDELESLTDTFTTKDQKVYKIMNNRIFNFLTYYYGKHMLKCLIKNANSGLIKDRFLLHRQDEIDKFLITVPQEYHEMFIQRMIEDWSKGKVKDVFSNINMKVPQFRQQLLFNLNKLNLTYQRQLANTFDIRTPRENTDDAEKDDAHDDDYDTVLLKCCRIGDASFVRWCLYLGLGTNKCNYYGQSPLIKACKHGHIEVVKLLLHNGADFNKRDDYYQSPLMMASAYGHTEIETLLLDKLSLF